MTFCSSTTDYLWVDQCHVLSAAMIFTATLSMSMCASGPHWYKSIAYAVLRNRHGIIICVENRFNLPIIRTFVGVNKIMLLTKNIYCLCFFIRWVSSQSLRSLTTSSLFYSHIDRVLTLQYRVSCSLLTWFPDLL